MKNQTEEQVSSHGNFGETHQAKKSVVVDHKPEPTRLSSTKIKPTTHKKNEVRLNPETAQKP